MALDEHDAVRVLRELGQVPGTITPLSGGAWSAAFLINNDDQDLVLRLGGSAEDYRSDAFAAHLDLAAVPVPKVLRHGVSGGLTYALSEFVPGTPLETVDSETWAGLVPQLADVCEALRGVRPEMPGDPGAWHRHLMEVGEYPWHQGWRDRADDEALALFDRGRRVLGHLDLADTPMSLVHADWINKNVHVLDGRIGGVFDWGCSRFSDHLYDLAWFEFWAPWHPWLDVGLLRTELVERWQVAGVDPLQNPDRLNACLVHIGLDHVVYNLLHGTAEDLRTTMERLQVLLDAPGS